MMISKQGKISTQSVVRVEDEALRARLEQNRESFSRVSSVSGSQSSWH
jgi:hypothetical protein